MVAKAFRTTATVKKVSNVIVAFLRQPLANAVIAASRVGS
jgi:hypothetical protein